MAGPYTCKNSHYNPPPNGKDELAGNTLGAFTNNSSTFTSTHAISRTFILAMLCAPIFTATLAPSSNSKLFKQFMKVYLNTKI